MELPVNALPLDVSKIRVDRITIPAKGKEIAAGVLRLDLIHPVISGNKWFKLRYYIEQAVKEKKSTLISFGGAWSNHIIALAAAGKASGLQTVGIIRGEKPASLSPTLRSALANGMQLHFVSREQYRLRTIPVPYDDALIIPEGGYGFTGARGAATILEYADPNEYDHIIAACGTGTMLAGLINGSLPGKKITGINVLKNNRSIEDEIRQLVDHQKPNNIVHGYHFGGYAKHTPELLAFMNDFFNQHAIPTDFVYTGKLMFALHQLAKEEYFDASERLLVIHSGGLQGNASLENGTLIF